MSPALKPDTALQARESDFDLLVLGAQDPAQLKSTKTAEVEKARLLKEVTDYLRNPSSPTGPFIELEDKSFREALYLSLNAGLSKRDLPSILSRFYTFRFLSRNHRDDPQVVNLLQHAASVVERDLLNPQLPQQAAIYNLDLFAKFPSSDQSERMKQIISDENSPVSVRVRALGVLAYSDLGQSKPFLLSLLHGNGNETIKAEAVSFLDRFGYGVNDYTALARNEQFSLLVRARALSMLFADDHIGSVKLYELIAGNLSNILSRYRNINDQGTRESIVNASEGLLALAGGKLLQFSNDSFLGTNKQNIDRALLSGIALLPAVARELPLTAILAQRIQFAVTGILDSSLITVSNTAPLVRLAVEEMLKRTRNERIPPADLHGVVENLALISSSSNLNRLFESPPRDRPNITYLPDSLVTNFLTAYKKIADDGSIDRATRAAASAAFRELQERSRHR